MASRLSSFVSAPRRGRAWLAGALLPLALGACDRGRLERGRALYAAHGCAACHGPAARGDGPTAARLAQRPRDLRDADQYQQGASEDAIAVSIRRGVGAMPPFSDLSPDDAAAVAAWLVSLQRSAAPGDGGLAHD